MRTLLGKQQETRASLTLWNIEVLLLYPAKECNALREDSVPLKVVCCYWPWRGGI
jgi:hypothetical protein